jgi:competence protein comEA helix-hairpin-helix repeat region
MVESTKADMKNAANDKLKSMTDSASSTKSTALDKVKEVKEKATSAKDAVKEKASALKEKATDAKTKAADNVKEVKEKATSTKESAKDKVASSAKVNINKADAETLQKLSGIGEKKAQAIIDYRNKVGKIKSAAELSNIDGIGEATIEKITPFLTF